MMVTAARKNVPTAPVSFPILTDGIGALLMVKVRSGHYIGESVAKNFLRARSFVCTGNVYQLVRSSSAPIHYSFPKKKRMERPGLSAPIHSSEVEVQSELDHAIGVKRRAADCAEPGPMLRRGRP